MQSSPENNAKKRNLADFVLLLVRWRKLIIANFFAICLVTIVIAFLLPKWYKVSCSILPPEEEGFSLGTFSSLISLLPGGGGGMELPFLATPSDVFASILKSRNVQEVVIKKNNLMRILETDNMDETLEALADLVKVSVGDEGIISLSVETKDAELSLSIAENCIQELDRVNREKRKTKARETRKFIENRLTQNKLDLQKAEDDLREFQEVNKLVSIEDQTRVTLQIAAELMAELQLKKVELGMIETTLNSSHQQLRLLKSNIKELEKQINHLSVGSDAEHPRNGQAGDFLNPGIPLQQIPRLGLEYFRLLREVKVQEAIFELITQQYEQVKIQEKRDTPTVQILDRPILPEIKSKPQRRLMVMIAGLLSLVFSIALVLVIEYLMVLRVDDPSEFAKYEQSYKLLRQDLNRLLRRHKS